MNLRCKNSVILLEDNLHLFKRQRVPLRLTKQMELRSYGGNLSTVSRRITPKDTHILILGNCEILPPKYVLKYTY